MGEVIVRRFDNSAALVAGAAERFVNVVRKAQAERGFASVVLTGGGNGIGLLKALAAMDSPFDWSAVDIYWGDDRFVAADSPDRNHRQAREALLDHVPVDPARIFPIAASDGEYGDDPDAAADAYARVLAGRAADGSVPDFDLHLLGMGGEGHINSLFPETDATRETERTVVAVRNSPKPPPTRVTLTLPAVNRSREVWMLVAGAEKADAVAAALNGASPDDIPAAGASGTEATVWFLDPAAASKLG